MDATDFVNRVKVRHPAIADEFDVLKTEPNTTLAAYALARLTQRAVDGGDRPSVTTCFVTALESWDEGDEQVQNSIGLSYLCQLNFDDGRVRRAWAWPLLHPTCKKRPG